MKVSLGVPASMGGIPVSIKRIRVLNSSLLRENEASQKSFKQSLTATLDSSNLPKQFW